MPSTAILFWLLLKPSTILLTASPLTPLMACQKTILLATSAAPCAGAAVWGCEGAGASASLAGSAGLARALGCAAGPQAVYATVASVASRKFRRVTDSTVARTCQIEPLAP